MRGSTVILSSNCNCDCFPFKDLVPAQICFSVVYKFACGSCHATYYGETSRHLKSKKGICIKGASSSIRDYNENGYAASSYDFYILDTANNNFDTRVF